jgi:Na+-driven multidrug efflux pump
MLKLICRVGGNSVIEQVALRIGFLVYARVVASLGTSAFAAHQIAMQLMNLSFTFAEGIAAAATSLVGQNLGKNRPDLSIVYGKIGQRLAFVVAMFLGAASILGRNVFPMMFTTEDHIIALAASLIMILGFIQPLQTSQIVMAGTLRGTGDTRYVALTMLLTVTFIRPLMCMLFVYPLGLGLQGAWYAIVFDQIVRLFLLGNRFSKGKWENIRV